MPHGGVSGFSLSFGRALKNLVGGRDRWLRWLDNSVAAPFGEEVPGLAEIHFVGLLGGDPHGPTLVDLGLAFAVVLGDLGNLQQLGLITTRGEAKDVQGTCFPLSRTEELGLTGEFDTAIEARLDPHLTPLLALGVDEPLRLSGSQVVITTKHAAALEFNVGRPG
jgi:hypothetical protein